MNLKGFKIDTNIIQEDCKESYTMIDNEDNFIEFIEVDSLLIVQYYKKCSRVKTQVYDISFDNEEDINTTIKEIYEQLEESQI